MHILGIILGILTAIGVWSYRLQMAKRGLDETRKFAEAARNMPRKRKFKSRAGLTGLDAIEDPRQAAAIMLLEVARGAGEVTSEHKAVMRGEIMQNFEMTEETADELVKAASWISRETLTSFVVMEKMTRTILNTPGLGPKQFVDLSNMLDEVALIEGGPFAEQVQLIRIFREKAGIQV